MGNVKTIFERALDEDNFRYLRRLYESGDFLEVNNCRDAFAENACFI